MKRRQRKKMANDNVVEVKIKADSKEAKDDISKFSKESKEALEGVEKNSKSSLGGLRKSLNDSVEGFNGMTAAIVATAAAVGAFKLAGMAKDVIVESVKVAVDAEKSFKGLETALQSAGNYSKEASDKLAAFGATLQSTTRYSDDDVNANLSLLESLTALNADGLIVAQKAAIDLSAAFGIDLHAATMLIGKAANGEVGAFGKLGIKIEEGATASETFANTLKALSPHMGRAEKDAETFEVALAQLNNAYGDNFENLGNIIISNEKVKESIQILRNVLVELANQIANNGKSIGDFVSSGLQLLISSIPIVINVMSGFISVVTKAYAGLQLYDGLIVSFAGKLVSVVAKYLEIVIDAWAQLGKVVLKTGEGFLSVLGAMSNLVGDDKSVEMYANWQKGLNDSEKALQKFIDTEYAKDFSQPIKDFGSDMIETSKDTVASGNKISKVFDKAANAVTNLDPAAKTAAYSLDGLVVKMKNGQSSTEKWSLATDKLAESIKKTAEESAKKQLDENIKVIDDIKKKYEDFGLSKLDIEQKSLSNIQMALDTALKENRLSIDEHQKLIKASTITYETNITKIKKDELDAQAKDLEEQKKASENSVKTAANTTETFIKDGIAGVASSAIAMIPGWGTAIAAAFELLRMDGEKFKETISELFNAEFVINISKNSRVMVEMLPKLVEDLVRELIIAAPELMSSFIRVALNPKTFITIIQGIIRGLADGIRGMLPKLSAAIKDIFARPITFKGLNLTKKFRESFNAMLSWFGEFGNKVKQAFIDAFEFIKKPIEALLGGIGAFFKAIWDGLVDVFKKVKEFLDPILTAISGIINFLIGVVKGLVTALWDMVKAIGQAVWAVISPVIDFVKGVFDGIWSAITAVGDWIVGIATSLWNALEPVRTFFAGIGTAIVEGFKSVVDFFSGLGESIKGAFTSAFDALKTKFDELWESTKQVFTDIGNGITGVFTAIGDGIKKVWDDALGWIKDLFGSGGKDSQDKGTGVVSGMVDKVKSWLPSFDVGGTVPNDMTANIHKGELIVPRDDLKELRSFMKNGQSQAPQQITLRVGEKELANVMLNLNRNGFRTA